MKRILLTFGFALFFLFPFSLRAQLEKVIVETYYVSDDSDATDTTSSVLRAGSTTYRIYIDMKPGYQLGKFYGNANHTFKIVSDSVFFNNTSNGQTFGKDMVKKRLKENTSALDTWLTLGQATTTASKITNFGVLKPQDRNGSFIGGVNNDGGSKPILNGLLNNSDATAGIPLTTEDGLDTMVAVPSAASWVNGGLIDYVSHVDSTIFGSVKPGNQFISNSFFLSCSGVTGVIRDSNQVLIAQLTTQGKISFELNVQVISANFADTLEYVAVKGIDSLSTRVHLAPFLKYPLPCGCNDPQDLEFNSSFACFAPGSCKTPVVLGCMDPLACNYDPNANINVSGLCCYPGLCNNRDISIVCPNISVHELDADIGFDLFPSPVQDQLTVKFKFNYNQKTSYSIYDSFGRLLIDKNIGDVSAGSIEQIELSGFASGLYLFRLSNGENFSIKRFVKN